jgi:hypothetical protein
MFATILGIVLPMLPSIIAGVEKLFGGKKDASQQKFDTVLQQAIALLQSAITNGQLAKGTVITDPAVGGAIETLVQQLNKLGLLKGTDTDLAAILKAIGAQVGATGATTETNDFKQGDVLKVFVLGKA